MVSLRHSECFLKRLYTSLPYVELRSLLAPAISLICLTCLLHDLLRNYLRFLHRHLLALRNLVLWVLLQSTEMHLRHQGTDPEREKCI